MRFRKKILLLADSCCQIFEDGASYRGRMKGIARDIVTLHYKNELFPVIEHCHNSNQRDEVVAENVKNLLDESLFLQGPRDNNVSFFIMNDLLRL